MMDTLKKEIVESVERIGVVKLWVQLLVPRIEGMFITYFSLHSVYIQSIFSLYSVYIQCEGESLN
jgi:hypothetical protein